MLPLFMFLFRPFYGSVLGIFNVLLLSLHVFLAVRFLYFALFSLIVFNF